MQHFRFSHQRYRSFIADFRNNRLTGSHEEQVETSATLLDSKIDGESRFVSEGLLRCLRDFLQLLWQHRYAVGIVIVVAVAAACAQMAEPLLMRFIVDSVLLARGALPTSRRVLMLCLFGSLFLALVLFSNLANGLKEYLQKVVSSKITLTLRRALLKRLLHLPLRTIRDIKIGGILCRLTGDVDTTTGLLQLALITPMLSVIRLILAAVILLQLNWRLAILAFAIVPGIVGLSLVTLKRIRPIYRSVRDDAEEVDGRVAETFAGIRVVRSCRRERKESLDYLGGRHAMLRKELFAHRRETAVWTSWNLLIGVVNVLIIWYGGYLNLEGATSIGDIMAFQWYTFLLLNPVCSLVNVMSELQRSFAGLERVFQTLRLQRDLPDRPGALDAPATVKTIEFQNVEFEYCEGKPVINNLSVTVQAGWLVGLVGKSGAGKTTTTDLIARFHDPTRGRILVNGQDIREFRLGSYRSLLAIVHQDVFLFSGSVSENIAYGSVDASQAAIEHAARRANAHEFIIQLPEKYQTHLGEHGARLSGGQQQRLAIARAILASPQILILDEATSNLDTESEQLIRGSMAAMFEDRTTFVIAHRLSTIRQANIILVMEAGRVVEQGSHEQLMRHRGHYHSMVLRQAENHGLTDDIYRRTEVV